MLSHIVSVLNNNTVHVQSWLYFVHNFNTHQLWSANYLTVNRQGGLTSRWSLIPDEQRTSSLLMLRQANRRSKASPQHIIMALSCISRLCTMYSICIRICIEHAHATSWPAKKACQLPTKVTVQLKFRLAGTKFYTTEQKNKTLRPTYIIKNIWTRWHKLEIFTV